MLTPLFPYFEADAGAEQMAWMNEQVGRAAEPDDQAAAIVWLAVGDSSWVNGVDLPVDGGLSAGMRDRLGRHQVVAGVAGPPPQVLSRVVEGAGMTLVEEANNRRPPERSLRCTGVACRIRARQGADATTTDRVPSQRHSRPRSG